MREKETEDEGQRNRACAFRCVSEARTALGRSLGSGSAGHPPSLPDTGPERSAPAASAKAAGLPVSRPPGPGELPPGLQHPRGRGGEAGSPERSGVPRPGRAEPGASVSSAQARRDLGAGPRSLGGGAMA